MERTQAIKHLFPRLWHWFTHPLPGKDQEQLLLDNGGTTEAWLRQIHLLTWLGYVFIYLAFATATDLSNYWRSYGLAGTFTVWLLIMSWVKLDANRKVSRLGWFSRPLKFRKWAKSLGYAFLFFKAEALTIILLTLLSGASFRSGNTITLLHLIKQQPLYYLYVLLVAPCLEELVFRQSIFWGLWHWFNSHTRLENKAVVLIVTMIVAWLFAMVHGDGNNPEYFIVGCYLQWIYWREHDLRMAMLTHAGINLMTLGIMLI